MLVIKDFNMPNNCMQCNFTYEDSCCTDHCIFTYNEVWDGGSDKRRKDCPLVCEIPEDAVAIIGIQKGDTNGDAIKALFPNIDFTEMAFTVHATTSVTLNGVKRGISYDFWKDWWNAPYERGKKK